MFANLLFNPFPTPSPAGWVIVSMETAPERATVVIADEGEGVPQGDLPHLFEPFYRADPSRARSSGGTGLGLAISKAICEKIGGSIAIDNLVGSGCGRHDPPPKAFRVLRRTRVNSLTRELAAFAFVSVITVGNLLFGISRSHP